MAIGFLLLICFYFIPKAQFQVVNILGRERFWSVGSMKLCTQPSSKEEPQNNCLRVCSQLSSYIAVWRSECDPIPDKDQKALTQWTQIYFCFINMHPIPHSPFFCSYWEVMEISWETLLMKPDNSKYCFWIKCKFSQKPIVSTYIWRVLSYVLITWNH